MTPAVWLSIGVTMLVTIAGWATLWGQHRQKVADLETRNTELSGRVTRCEDRHGETAGRIGAMEVDMAVLKERSGTTISALGRIEAKLETKARAARRAAE